MADQTRRTKLLFLAGVFAAIALVPLLALAATSASAVADGTTFNASDGPEVTTNGSQSVATNNLFPDADTVRLGSVTISGAEIETNISDADTSLPLLKPQVSPTNRLTLGHDNTSLSAAVTGGNVTELALNDSANVGGTAADILVATGATATNLTVTGLPSGSNVTFIDVSGGTTQVLGDEPVISGEATLPANSLGANVDRDILLATSAPNFVVNITGTNSPVVEGNGLTIDATINNTGGAQGTQTVTLDAGALGTTSKTVTLSKGGTTTQTFTIPTSTGDAGSFTATVDTGDDTASQSVDVLRNVSDFQLDIASVNTPVRPGDTLIVDVIVENVGALADTQDIQLSTGGAVRDSVPVSLAGGASTTVTLTFDSSSGGLSTVATVSSENDTEEIVLTEAEQWNQVNNEDTGSRGPVAISPDGDLVAHGEGSQVVIYDVQTDTAIQNVNVASGDIGALDWHPDGDRIVLTEESADEVYIYDVASASLVDTLTFASNAGVRAAEWSPDGDRLLFGSGNTAPGTGAAHIVDADNGALLRTVTPAGGRGVAAVGWSGDSQRFAIGTGPFDVDVEVYEVGGGLVNRTNQSNSPIPQATIVQGLAFAQNGTRLVIATGADNSNSGGTPAIGNVRLFEVGTGTQLAKVNVAGSSTSVKRGAVADPTSDQVLVTSEDGPSTIFAVTGSSLARLQNLSHATATGGTDVDWAHSGEYVTDSVGAGGREFADGNEWRVFANQPTVDGTVSDSNGNPVENVTVELARNGQRIDATQTDANGNYVLLAPIRGQYELTAVKTSGNEQIFETKNISVPSDGATIPFTTTLINTGISGQVVDRFGNPISAATVTTNQSVQSFPTNTQGRFVLDTQPGAFVVSASAPGFRSASKEVTVIAGNVTGGVRLQLDKVDGVPIAGTVTDFNGNPIEGADVFVGPNATTTGLQGNYIAEVGSTGTFVVTAANAVDSETRTVTITDPNGTDGVDFVLERAADPPNASGNLEIRFENTGGLVNNRTVTVGFFDDSQEQFAERTTTTGLIDLGTLNEEAPLVAVVEAPELFARRIIIRDLAADSIAFLLDDDKANTSVIVNEFDIRDNTGRFSGPDTRFTIKRAMPLPGETDDVPLRVLAEDLLGADEQFGIALQSDVRYRIVVENGNGDIRDLGPHFAVSEGRVVIEIGAVEFNVPGGSTFSADAKAETVGNNTERVTFSYVDPENLTSQVSVKIFNASNESEVILDQTKTAPPGGFGNLTISDTITGNATGARLVVEYTAVRNETQSGTITVAAEPSQLGIPLSNGLQQIIGVGMIIVVAGLFSARNAAVGAIVVPGLAGALWLVGVLSGVVSGAAIGLALTVGVAYQLATGGT